MIGGLIGAVVAAGFRLDPVTGDGSGAVVSMASRALPAVVTGSLSRALVGFAQGALAGYEAGAAIDAKVIRAFQCRACGVTF